MFNPPPAHGNTDSPRSSALGRASRGRADRHDDVDLVIALQGARRRFCCSRIASAVAQEQSDMAALFETSGPESFAQPLDTDLVGAAVVDHAYAPDTTRLSMGRKKQRRLDGDRSKRRDDLPPPHEHLPRKRTCSRRE
jgi:hypothetical protein